MLPQILPSFYKDGVSTNFLSGFNLLKPHRRFKYRLSISEARPVWILANYAIFLLEL
jgi:hypothetical protein